LNRKLYLLVRLRVRDVTALTAEETIRRWIEGGEKLARLDRADLWEFTYRDDGDFRGKIEELVNDSNLFVNPNKHTFRFADDYREGWEEEVFLAVVRGREDLEGAVARNTLESRYRLAGLEDVRYATLWVFRFDGVTGDEALGLAESFAVTRTRKDGLLVNPHYQICEVKPAGPAGEDAHR